MRPLVTLRRALEDPHLLATVMGGESREPMRALLLASQGEALAASEREHWRRLTGREREPLQRAEELHVLAGRRSGKSSGCAAIAVYLSALCDHSDNLSPGERGVVLLVAENQRQAKILLRYVEGAFDASPALRALIANRTATSLSLNDNIDVEVRAADFRALRGLTLVAAIGDEICHWRSEESTNPDVEVVDAIRPGLVTTSGQLFTIGSPYAKRGFAYSTFARDYGPDGDPRIIVAKGATRDFNATISQLVIDRAIERDPSSAASEWLGEFRTDLESYIARETVDACTVADRFELPRISGVRYVAFVDPAAGGPDAYALAIAHAEGARIILDLVRGRERANPDDVTAEFAGVIKSFGIARATSDRFAGAWPVERFKSHGVTLEQSAQPKSAIYQEALPLLNARRVELLDDKRLTSQLCALERRTARGGRDSIDHPPNQHDDIANAACGALVLAAAAASRPAVLSIPFEWR